MRHATEKGIEFVIENPENNNQIIAEIHCSKPGPKIFDHVLSELTTAVHPDFQGQGIGKKIFVHLLQYITVNRPDILRVELFTQASNERAQSFYKKIGFTPEGKFLQRIAGSDKKLETDIPMAWFNPGFKP